jgi:hypothetical protein
MEVRMGFLALPLKIIRVLMVFVVPVPMECADGKPGFVQDVLLHTALSQLAPAIRLG